MNNNLNLDQLCARHGYEMCQDVKAALDNKTKDSKAKTENLITKSLGVLQEDGVYAFFLYLGSLAKGADENKSGKNKEPKKDHEAAVALARQAAALLHNEGAALDLLPLSSEESTISQILDAICKTGGLADDLDRLLLAKRLLEQALIYARYHAKALGG